MTPVGDHPRVCGEHLIQSRRSVANLGSSPRVRGTPFRVARGPPPRGIIPACAGNTDCPMRRLSGRWDHPRVCGEHYKHRGSITPNPGSSPRVRGTLACAVTLRLSAGIIPACAGNTRASPDRCAHSRDHPRVCGEHALLRLGCINVGGSSPRVRGTQQHRRPQEHAAGIIPACAGNTGKQPHRRGHTGDHPRVCGEHSRLPFWSNTTPGSSPRVRGTRKRRPEHGRCLGIIPACAGNTLRK